MAKGYYNEADHPENLLDEQEQENVYRITRQPDEEKPAAIGAEPEKVGNDTIVGGGVQKDASVIDPYAGTRGYIQTLIEAGKKRGKDLEKSEKLSRVHEAVAGISDMGRALTNLYYTNQYSPNAFEPSGLSDKARERWERAKAEREKNRESIMNYHMMQDKLDDADRQWKYKMERDKVADERADAAARQAQENFERRQSEVERAHKEQEELKRQANLIADWKAKNGQSRRSGGKGGTKQDIIFTDGLGGTINVPKGSLLGEVYGCIPAKYRRVMEYKTATDKQMQYDIERYLGDRNMNPDIQENIRTLLHLLEGDVTRTSKPQKPQSNSGGSLLPKTNKPTGSLLPKK